MTNPSEIVIAGYAFPAVVIVDPVTGLPVPITNVIPTTTTVVGDVVISGPLTVTAITAPVAIAGTVPVSGTVAVSAVAAPVSIAGTVPVSVAAPVPIAGTVPISGTVAVSGVGGSVAVSAVAAPVSIAGTVPVSGTLAVSSVGGTVAIAGTVPVSVAAPAPVNITTPAPISVNSVPSLPVSNLDPITGAIASMIRDYLIEVGFLGNTGAYLGHRRVSVLGNNPSINTAGTPADVWSGGGLYPWMAATTFLEVVSSSAADTAVGTGARTVTISGLTAAWAEVTQTVTLLGTVAVPIPTSLYRINAINIASAGSGKVNAGTLTIRDLGAGATRGVVQAGYGTARQGVYTVPAGYTLQIIAQAFSINRAGAAAHATIAIVSQSSTGFFRMPFETSVSDAVPYFHDGMPGVAVPEKTDVCYRVTSVANNGTDVSASLLGVMRLNGLT